MQQARKRWKDRHTDARTCGGGGRAALAAFASPSITRSWPSSSAAVRSHALACDYVTRGRGRSCYMVRVEWQQPLLV